ncbi:MAG TPA: EamA family transporter [Candidatus Nanopelagicales bacterium]|nr:EamA family transporter [Candidatus Nanopelagicales bacterium]
MTTAAEPRTAGPQTGSPAQVWSALGVVYVVWGSTYLGIAVTVRTLPPLVAMGMRFFVAAAIIAAFLVLRRGRRALSVSWPELRGAMVVGVLLLGVGMGMVTMAEQYVPSGVAALIVSIMPVWVVLLRTVTGDRPRLVTWLGVAVGFAGMVVLVHPGADVATVNGASDAQRALWSMLMPIGTLCWAVGSFLQPRIRTPRDPLVLTTYEMLTGGTVLALVGLLRGEKVSQLADADAASWAAWAYLVTAGSLIAYLAFVWLVDHAPLSLISTYAYVNPVVAVLLGWLILGEPLSGGVLFGGAIIVSGVVLVVSGERLSRQPDAPEPLPGEPG